MTSSTINPALPAQGGAFSSSVIRGNFQAAVNDINALWNAYVTAPVFNSITAGATPFAITGLAASQGGSIAITGGVSSATNAGGDAAVTGGAGTGGGSAGGTASLIGGVSGLGTTGTGGIAHISGGAARSTNGNGGQANIEGGAGSAAGIGNGGSVNLTGGASASGSTGAGGAVNLTGGAAASSNGNGGDISVVGGAKTGSGTVGKVILDGSALKVGASQTAANGSVATVLGSIGPVGSHTTVQKWLTIQDSGGTALYIPCF